ncbi:hypothetical protein [Amnibacterium sp.]|uniref:hypothetical protein n=1 Tax=Amnibacterium sp. TaxID=1872496 RepID=UPI002616BC7D|nr:hypothetical protein [Amnibacterium sp.]MCU1472516.1 hypothetical protein [Amnibacterium sp.]
MTVQAEAPVTHADRIAPTEVPSTTSSQNGPPVYLGMRRGWWVVVSLLVLVGVDLIPMVGPYLSLAALMWMISGLTRAQPRSERLALRRRAANPHTAEPLRRAARADRGAALPTS